MGRNQTVKRCVTAITIACFCAPVGLSVHALPANPECPLAAQTCEAALLRLAEAQAGSPLISAEEQVQILRVARADAVRLCGADQIDGRLHIDPAPVAEASRPCANH